VVDRKFECFNHFDRKQCVRLALIGIEGLIEAQVSRLTEIYDQND